MSQAVEDGEEEEDHVELVGQPEEVVGLLADLGDGEDEDDGHGDVEEDAGEAGQGLEQQHCDKIRGIDDDEKLPGTARRRCPASGRCQS